MKNRQKTLYSLESNDPIKYSLENMNSFHQKFPTCQLRGFRKIWNTPLLVKVNGKFCIAEYFSGQLGAVLHKLLVEVT